MTLWERWLRHPQALWLRKAIFQVHLWSGIGVGLYIVVICFSGSVLVYRVELRQTFIPQPEVRGRFPRADGLGRADRSRAAGLP